MWFLFIVPCCPFVNCTQKVNKKERFDLAKKSRASSAERKRAALCSSALSMNISTLRAAFFNDPTQPRGVFCKGGVLGVCVVVSFGAQPIGANTESVVVFRGFRV